MLPVVQERSGLTEENALKITSDPTILGRMLGDGKTVGEILADQLIKGQDNYSNATSALYDTSILLNLLQILIVLAAVGAFMNVIPFFLYDFNEIKQRSVVKVLKVRAMFEDFGNSITNDAGLVEGIEIIRTAREYCSLEPRVIDKKSYRSVKDKEEKKAAKKAYFADLEFNKEIEIAKFVCKELDRFSTQAGKFELSQAKEVYSHGINAILTMNKLNIKEELKAAKNMSKASPEEKEIRKTAIENARKKISAVNSVNKYFKNTSELIQPDFAELDRLYDKEDELNAELKALYLEKSEAKKAKNAEIKAEAEKKIADLKNEKKLVQKKLKEEMNSHAYFNRAAKPFTDAEKLVKQSENYTHLDEIAEKYEAAKARLAQVSE